MLLVTGIGKIQVTFSINGSWKQWQQKPVQITIKNATIADHVISLLLCQASHRPFLHLDKNGRLGCSVCFVLFQGTHQYLHRWTSDSWTHCWTCRRMEESDCRHDTMRHHSWSQQGTWRIWANRASASAVGRCQHCEGCRGNRLVVAGPFLPVLSSWHHASRSLPPPYSGSPLLIPPETLQLQPKATWR